MEKNLVGRLREQREKELDLQRRKAELFDWLNEYFDSTDEENWGDLHTRGKNLEEAIAAMRKESGNV